MANLLIKATTYKALQAKEKALKEEMEKLKAEMIEEMNGKEEITCGQYTIRNKVITSRVLDTKRLKAERPDVAEEFTEEKETTRFSIG